MALFALAQPIFGGAPLGDVLHEDREPARVRKNPILEPAIEVRRVRLDLTRFPFGEGALILEPERLADALGELGPDVLSDQR